jgi:hypothetical protein
MTQMSRRYVLHRTTFQSKAFRDQMKAQRSSQYYQISSIAFPGDSRGSIRVHWILYTFTRASMPLQVSIYATSLNPCLTLAPKVQSWDEVAIQHALVVVHELTAPAARAEALVLVLGRGRGRDFRTMTILAERIRWMT